MKLDIKYIIVVLTILLCIEVQAQQNPVMTHYTINPYLYNPAQVGESGYNTFSAHYRKQWIGMPDAPDTKLLSGQGLINDKYGIGGKIYLDRAHIVQNFGALFSYAYYIRTKKNPSRHYFSIGLSAGVKSQRLFFNEATIKDDLDPKIFYQGATNTVFDAEVGINYRFKNLRLAAFASNIAPHSYNYQRANSQLDYKPSYHIYGNVGYDLILGKKKTVTLKPSVLVRYIPQVPFQFDGNLLLDWKSKLWVGMGYRYKNAGAWATAGVRIHDAVSVSYSYEQSIDGYQAALGSTHEMTLEYRFKKKDKDKVEELEDKFDRMRKNLLSKNKELLDSLQAVKDRVDSLEGDFYDSQQLISELQENNNNNNSKGNEVKYATLGRVNFFLNSATIHKEQEVEANAVLAKIDSLTEDNKLIMIRIEGSASIEGSETYNLILSNKRNEAMKDFLISKGVNPDQITLSSKGSSEAMVRDDAFEDLENAKPNPEDRYVKVFVLYND